MQRPTKLFPEIEPYKKDYFHTSDGHHVYYELCGNPKGKPITFIPGGPGAGFDTQDRRFFDPNKWSILLIDLRGSGRSKPLGKIDNNTTQLAAKDIYDINRMLQRERTALFGVSWGSTLASAYTIIYPETVLGIVERGILLGEADEINYYTTGKTATSDYDKAVFTRFIDQVMPEWKNNPTGYYYHQVQPESPPHRRTYFAYEWLRFEICMSYGYPRPENQIEDQIKMYDYISWSLIETHYFAHNCFLEDHYIINNVNSFPDVPIIILQGEDDKICPAINARRLHTALPKSKLFMVKGGHSSSEPETTRLLVSETDALWDMI